MKNKKQIPEWMKLMMVLVVVVAFSYVTISKMWLINQNPVEEEKVQVNPKTEQQILEVGSAKLRVEVRRTEAEQELGLSWRSSMDQDEGMVFEYLAPQRVLYWMKGMKFPLDFIWVLKGKVIEITQQVSEPTLEHPVVKTVSPMGEVDLVIETNAGWVEKNGIKIGDEVKY